MKQQYDSYKSSGIDWIGGIPSHWDIQRMRYLCDIITGDKDTVNRVEDGLYPFYVRSPQIERIKSYSFDGEAVLMAGDGVGAGKVLHYVNGKFDFHQRVYNFHNFNGIKGKLLYLYLKSLFKYKIEEGGAKNTVDSVRQPWLKDFPVCVPPLAEQEAIAAWLDEKCEEIDAAIAKVDREIELIDELKQSEISRVVTRGLNPDAPLRPSGIEWIGDIPEHWAIRKTAQIFHGIGSGTTPTSGSNKYYSEVGVNWLQTGDLNDGNITNTSKKITTTALTDFSSLKIYPKGSIVIAMYGATIGKLGKLNIETTTNQACCVLPKSNEIDNDFAFYVFWAGKRALINSAYGGGQPNISQDTIKSFKLALPPLSEQQAIADYLDKKCAAIDGLKAKLTKKREMLTELRQSIISEVVTGKRKVI